jgi:hypothetical protein
MIIAAQNRAMQNAVSADNRKNIRAVMDDRAPLRCKSRFRVDMFDPFAATRPRKGNGLLSHTLLHTVQSALQSRYGEILLGPREGAERLK